MKLAQRLGYISVLCSVLVVGVAAQELNKEEWQKQVADLTTRRNDLKNKLSQLQGEVAALKRQDSDKAAAIAKCQQDLADLTKQEEAPLNASLDLIDGRLNELSRLSNQDLWARRAELDSVQNWINKAKSSNIAGMQKFSDRLNGQQARVDGLKRTLQQMMEQGTAMQTYTVGTWARDRDCLWNIAKKPKIYDNAFLWPKIWQGNRDQIKNPDIIHTGQKLKIPSKAELTGEEKSALRSYWNKKQAAAAPSK